MKRTERVLREKDAKREHGPGVSLPRTTLTKGYVTLIISVFLFVLVCFLDFLVPSGRQFNVPHPTFSHISVLRSVLLFASALMLILSITKEEFVAKGRQRTDSAEQPYMAFSLGKLGTLRVSASFFLWGGLLLLVLFTLLFTASPEAFTWLRFEDGPVEMISALALFLSFSLFIYLAIHTHRADKKRKSLHCIILALFALLFFVIGMEEVSWFQRFLSLGTPSWMGLNEQGEIGLHNFATTASELLYYFGSFLFLILLPFWDEQRHLGDSSSILDLLSPSRSMIFVAACFVPFNYNLWYFPTVQLEYFATLLVLIYYTWLSARQRMGPLGGKYYLPTLLCACILTQAIFLAAGNRFLLEWDVTEYKELLIAMSFLIYSAERVMEIRKVVPLAVVALAFSISLVLLLLRLFPWVVTLCSTCAYRIPAFPGCL